eukprot:SAG31_NODE_545_length_14238_cov_15.518849_14_plen_126_part_00
MSAADSDASAEPGSEPLSASPYGGLDTQTPEKSKPSSDATTPRLFGWGRWGGPGPDAAADRKVAATPKLADGGAAESAPPREDGPIPKGFHPCTPQEEPGPAFAEADQRDAVVDAYAVSVTATTP